MPYNGIDELRKNLRDILPKHAQEIFIKAYNSAWDEYADPDKRRGDDSREEVANKVAWNAVKAKYEKGDNGNWHRKSS